MWDDFDGTGVKGDQLMTNMKRVTLTLFISGLLAVFAATNTAQRTDSDPAGKVKTGLLNIPVVASDKSGRFVVGLGKDDFSVYQDGQKQKIEYFSNGEAQVCAAVVIDVSGNAHMSSSSIKKAANLVIDSLGENDRVAVYTFGDRTTELQKLSPVHADAKNAVKKLDFPAKDVFQMSETVTQVLKEGFGGCGDRTAIFVISQGDELREQPLTDLLDTVAEKETLIYSILIGEIQPTPIYKDQDGVLRQVNMIVRRTQEDLKDIYGMRLMITLAQQSGGRFIIAAESDMAAEVKKIYEELRSLYVIGIYPEIGSDRAANGLTLQVTRPEATSIRTKGTIRLKASTAENKK